MVVNRNI